MHISLLKLLPFTIHHVIKSIKSITAPATDARPLYGSPTTGGGAQIIGGELDYCGLRANLIPETKQFSGS